MADAVELEGRKKTAEAQERSARASREQLVAEQTEH